MPAIINAMAAAGQDSSINDICINKWEITWANEMTAIIGGETSKIPEGQGISAYLLGLYRGNSVMYKADSYVSSERKSHIRFLDCRFGDVPGRKVPLQEIAHWIIIKVDFSLPVYTASILPDPTPICMQLNKTLLLLKLILIHDWARYDII